MKPVAIFRFSAEDGPGYFASFLDRNAVPWTLFKLDEGSSLPDNPDDYAGFVFMGGPMSVNDDLPWGPAIINLIRHAVASDQPCIGHCLGGQLMSKAMGGHVTGNRVKEIGWNNVRVVDSALASDWLGKDDFNLTTFQWHGETFSIPDGAERILTGDACENQAFVMGKSLGMQCHTEMTPEMVEDWCQDWAAENADPSLPSIQTPEEMLAATGTNILALNRLADRLYAKWLEGVYPHLNAQPVSRESC
ncbi:MAG: type 1 glutamine amidotransferase [Burkholderiales bacterium]|nr:type 1 glutamine amidotransferase [Burkholderiales bacterium]